MLLERKFYDCEFLRWKIRKHEKPSKPQSSITARKPWRNVHVLWQWGHVSVTENKPWSLIKGKLNRCLGFQKTHFKRGKVPLRVHSNTFSLGMSAIFLSFIDLAALRATLLMQMWPHLWPHHISPAVLENAGGRITWYKSRDKSKNNKRWGWGELFFEKIHF